MQALVELISNRAAKKKNLVLLTESLMKWLPIYEIENQLRKCAFLAQIAYETGGFVFFKELGSEDYFKKYEPDTKIGKMLGNTKIGDGYKFKGRGPLQITGRSNYKIYGGLIGEDLLDDPELLLIPDIGMHASCEFWHQLGLNKLADQSDIRGITKKINGGLNGLEERVNYYNVLIKATDAHKR